MPQRYPIKVLISNLELPKVAEKRAEIITASETNVASEINNLKLQTLYAGAMVFYKRKGADIFIAFAGQNESIEMDEVYKDWMNEKYPELEVVVLPNDLPNNETISFPLTVI
jgi:hypothetical protein